MKQAKTLEIVPDQAQYRPRQSIGLYIRLGQEKIDGWRYELTVLDLSTPVVKMNGVLQAEDEEGALLQMEPILNGSGAYGVFARVISPDGHTYEGETAFDVAEHWREAPRYGFLSDFHPEEAGRLEDVSFLNRLHINVVQFYDWMYRHDRLLPDSDEFVDPLDRRLSLSVVREKIAALREKGIASMAYAAVYASLPDYLERHPEQGLYQNNGKPYALGNYFHIMDISEESEWTKHMLQEYKQAIRAMGFDGIHLDQYGFPKKAIRMKDGKAEVVSLKHLYPRFIDLVREELSSLGEGIGVVFNNVSNYPTHTTAEAAQDIVYVEVWDPAERLRDLKEIIDQARRQSGKHVVLAAYFPRFHPETAKDLAQAEAGAALAMAVIFASGGYHMLLGEEGKVLADPYFPNYGALSEGFRSRVQRYYDFIVMYRNVLYDHELDDVSMAFAGGINTEVVCSKDSVRFTPNPHLDAVWTMVKEKPGYTVLHFLNLLGIDNDIWHEGKAQSPAVLDEIEVKVEIWEEIEGIYWAAPDGCSIRPEPLDYQWVRKDEHSGYMAAFTLPKLEYWSMVWIKTRTGVPAQPYSK